MYCKYCGKQIEVSDEYCNGCGNKVEKTESTNISTSSQISETNKNSGVDKTHLSYVFSSIGAFISLILRINLQEIYYTYESIMNNQKVYGIDPDMKPIFTVIPVIAGIIAILNIVSEKRSDTQKKITAFIINAIIIVVAVLFIWYDIPYDLLDF